MQLLGEEALAIVDAAVCCRAGQRMATKDRPIWKGAFDLTTETRGHRVLLRQEGVHGFCFAVADATRDRMEVLDELELHGSLDVHEGWAQDGGPIPCLRRRQALLSRAAALRLRLSMRTCGLSAITPASLLAMDGLCRQK